MIEQLNGIHETVNYKPNTNFRLYDNIAAEDYPMHWHTPLEIIIPIVNDYSVTVGDSTKILHPSDIMFICPGVIHSLKAPDTGRRIIILVDLTFFYQIKSFESMLNLISPTMIITATDSPQLHTILYDKFLSILNDYNNDVIYSELAIYSKLLDIFVELRKTDCLPLQNLNINSPMPKEHIEKFIHICQYIGDHCTEDLSLQDIAQLSGFSKYHFTRLFKQFTNITFYKYLTKKRIAYAEQLLINPELSILEVALQSGFSNQSAFIRMFKLTKSCTPTEFRNMYCKK